MRTANPYSPGSPEPLAAAAATPLPSPPTPAPIPNPIRVALLADFEIIRWTLSASPRVTSVVISPRASVMAVSDTLISLPFRVCPFLSLTLTSSPGGIALSPSQEPVIGAGVTCANANCGFANMAIRANATTIAPFFLKQDNQDWYIQPQRSQRYAEKDLSFSPSARLCVLRG